VQVIGTVVAVPAARHDKDYGVSGIAAHPCKKRKDGAATLVPTVMYMGFNGYLGPTFLNYELPQLLENSIPITYVTP
jgi:hypothetical protein